MENVQDITENLKRLDGLKLLDYCFDNDIVSFKSGFGDYIVLCRIVDISQDKEVAEKIYKVQQKYHEDMKADIWAKGQFGNAGED